MIFYPKRKIDPPNRWFLQFSQFTPDEKFDYNNGAYVVLALIAERVSGESFYDIVDQRVCARAGLLDTGFFRSDELPGRAATGYLASTGSERTNVLHLPVRGSGDGGIYSTVADLSRLWTAFFEGRIVAHDWVARMVKPRSHVPESPMTYGLGFWLHGGNGTVLLTGSDAGVSFMSQHSPSTSITSTVISNTSEGAWPIARLLRDYPSNS
ncbi:MAG: serine hydrolase domain-containing protein [Actinomycetota bacterium]